MLPHLIHVGLPKTGSTFLQHWFERHPQIAYAKGGIAGCTDVWHLTKSAGAPDPVWRCRVTSSETLTYPLPAPSLVEVGTESLKETQTAQEAVCDTLHLLFPDAFVLVVTRGYAGVLRSGYSQYLRVGGDRSAATMLPMMARVAGMVGLYDYDRIAALYRRRFGARTIVLPYELLRDDLPGFLEQIEQPLGLDLFDAGEGSVNASLSSAQMHWYPRLARAFASIPMSFVRDRLLAQHRWRAERGGWSKLVALLERAAGPAPEPPRFDPRDLAHLAPLAAQLRAEPAFRPYASEYLG